MSLERRQNKTKNALYSNRGIIHQIKKSYRSHQNMTSASWKELLTKDQALETIKEQLKSSSSSQKAKTPIA